MIPAGLPPTADAPVAGWLPLNLPSPPPLPGRIQPEASVPCAEPFDDPDWLFCVDWDGSRALLFISADGTIRLQGETLEDVTERFPELGRCAAGAEGRSAVLDGVVAVLDAEGRPDLVGLGRRIAAGARGSTALPTVYLAFDVLHLGGRPTMGWSLERRLEAVAGFSGGDSLQVPDHVAGRGSALAQAASARGLAALGARRADAPYRPGVASPDRLRISLRDQATVAVAGILRPPRREPRLILGEYIGGRLTAAGQAEAPQDPEIAEWLSRRVEALATHPPALDGVHPAGVTWLRPGLTATVTHAGRGAGGQLEHAELLAVRDDVDPRWCLRRAPLARPRVTGSAGFMPTVLAALPIGEAALDT